MERKKRKKNTFLLSFALSPLSLNPSRCPPPPPSWMRAVLRGLRQSSSPGRRLPVTMSSASSRKVAASSTPPSAASRHGAAGTQRSSQKQTRALSSSSSPSVLQKIAQMYMDALAQRPMLTKSVTCFVGKLCFFSFQWELPLRW